MESKYRFTKNPKSYVRYHLAFCTRRRRGILQMDGVEARFKELLLQICAQNDYDILAFECGADYCYLHVSVLPDVSPYEVCKNIKYGTGPTLIAEFPQLTSQVNVWTRSFFASTAEYLPPEEIQEYIRSQPKRF